MKKAIGWVLVVFGGLFLISSIIAIPVLLANGGATLGERVFGTICAVVYAAGSGLICWFGFRLKAPLGTRKATQDPSSTPAQQSKPEQIPMETWMTSQLPALYVRKSKAAYRKHYIHRLELLGFTASDAQKLFDFECDVIRRFPKQCLLERQFTQMRFFNLKQPFFMQYPQTKEDILQERWLTVSELCKIVDEAEWHYWNSHEQHLPDAVWQEICAWRLSGPGADFLVQYFKMIEEETGIPEDSLAKLSSEQGRHLSKCAWQ